ncbi:putative carboxylesterase [Rosa chinensis]|uniref:Putative carboxylesterase n=1 Tax=Rosa chinensis TaxID=74649 RepID=A0A2P6PKK3_ROSCH|nr:putative carboxylesterase [Rosa chinensis]
MWKAFLPEGSDRDHPVVNVFGPNAVDISGVDFPATIVFVGGFDPLQDWQKRYYEGLKKRGKQAELVVFPNAIHTFYAYPELEDSSVFISRVRDFVQNAMLILLKQDNNYCFPIFNTVPICLPGYMNGNNI